MRRAVIVAAALRQDGAAARGTGAVRRRHGGRYHEDSRASAELDPVFRTLWEDGAKDELPRAGAWLREAAPGDQRSPDRPGFLALP
jgi:hypothetical protein